jgi:hypothetical protein
LQSVFYSNAPGPVTIPSYYYEVLLINLPENNDEFWRPKS